MARRAERLCRAFRRRGGACLHRALEDWPPNRETGGFFMAYRWHLSSMTVTEASPNRNPRLICDGLVRLACTGTGKKAVALLVLAVSSLDSGPLRQPPDCPSPLVLPLLFREKTHRTRTNAGVPKTPLTPDVLNVTCPVLFR